MKPYDDLYYDFGTYMTRRCSSTWEYCNGDCDNCYKKKDPKDQLRGYTFSRNEIQNTQGYPKYLFRRIP